MDNDYNCPLLVFVVEKLECWHKSLSLLASQSKIHCVSRVVSGRSKSRRAPPSRSNCLHFHAIFVKILQNWFLPQTQGLATTVREILDPPLANTNIKRQTDILETNTDDNTTSCFPNKHPVHVLQARLCNNIKTSNKLFTRMML